MNWLLNLLIYIKSMQYFGMRNIHVIKIETV
nr:unnamed protein product [Callosobruchus chinensis]